MTSAGVPDTVSAVRGPLVYFRDDPFLTDPARSLVHEPDGLVLCRNGVIDAVGPASELAGHVPAGVTVDAYPDGLISAGFIDAHVHYVQTGIIGAYGEQLLDWLNDYTYVAEQALADKGRADALARVFCDELLRNGTTSAMVFCAVYPASVDALFEEAERRGLRIVAGKVLMDRHAPAALLDTPQSAYDDSKALIAKWHGRGRLLYAITPRFAPTSSPAQLELAGALWKEHPDVFVHSHISEHPQEVSWVRELFPERRDYLDVYAHYGLIGRRAVLAHGVHLTEAELCRCHETGTALAHCPTSNLFLGSGLFKLAAAKDAARPVHVGIGTDIGAGTTFSLLGTLNEAYKVAQLGGSPLDARRAFFLATLGGARALGLDDRIGTLRAGNDADLVVLDPSATPLLRFRTERVRDIDELLFVLMTLGDDRAVRATYVGGRLAHARDGV